MKEYTKKLLVAFLIITLLKIVISSFILAPSMFNDEYIYAKKAQSFIQEGNFQVNGRDYPYSFFYPVIISVAYLAKDMEIIFFIIKLINALLSSLIIIPAWLLAREFLDERKSFISTILILCLPSVFAFAGFIMGENLFYAFFLFSVYFIYKSLISPGYRFGILAGVCIVVSSLIKNTGLILLLVPLVGYIANARIQGLPFFLKGRLKKVAVIYLAIIILFLLVLPVTLNSQSFGYLASSDASDVTAVVRHNDYFIPMISWFAIYLGFLMLSSGVLLGVFSFFPLKETNPNAKLFSVISWLTIGLVLFVGANHAAGGPVSYGPFSWFTERPIGRYVDIVTPLLVILGIIGFEIYEQKKLYGTLKKGLIVCTLLLAWASQLNLAPLFPVNNLALTHFGLLKLAFESIIYGYNVPSFSWMIFVIMLIAFIALPILFIYLNSKKKLILSKVAIALIIYFLMIGSLVYAVTGYNAYKYWYSGEQMTLGRWIDDNLKENIPLFIDKQECSGSVIKTNQSVLCDSTRLFSAVGFFVNKQVLIDDISNIPGEAYVLSSHKLQGVKLLRQTGHFYIYRHSQNAS